MHRLQTLVLLQNKNASDANPKDVLVCCLCVFIGWTSLLLLSKGKYTRCICDIRVDLVEKSSLSTSSQVNFQMSASPAPAAAFVPETPPSSPPPAFAPPAPGKRARSPSPFDIAAVTFEQAQEEEEANERHAKRTRRELSFPPILRRSGVDRLHSVLCAVLDSAVAARRDQTIAEADLMQITQDISALLKRLYR